VWGALLGRVQHLDLGGKSKEIGFYSLSGGEGEIAYTGTISGQWGIRLFLGRKKVPSRLGGENRFLVGLELCGRAAKDPQKIVSWKGTTISGREHGDD